MDLRESLGFSFSRDASHVYYHDITLHDRKGLPIQGIVVREFRALSRYMATDGERVYACTFKNISFTVLQADAGSFQLLDASYAVDANHVYFQNRLLRGASPAHFRLLDNGWAHDDRLLYRYGRQLKGANVAALRWFNGGRYLADDRHVWHDGREVVGADAASFVYTDGIDGLHEFTDQLRPYAFGAASYPGSSEEWEPVWSPFFTARPDLQGYWWHKLVDQQRVGSGARELGEGFRIVGNQVYLNDQPLLEPDAATTRLLGDSFIADHKRIYSYVLPFHTVYGGPIPGALEGWRRLTHGWYQAGDYAYRRNGNRSGHAEAAKIDGATFEVLNATYARDCRGVLCGLVRKRDIDPRRAECIGGGYLRDSSQLYWAGKVVKASFDVASAEYLGREFIRDARGRMLNSGRPYHRGIDCATLTFLSPYFARDRARVYGYRDGELVALPGVDPARFQIEREDVGFDGAQRYVHSEWVKDVLYNPTPESGASSQTQRQASLPLLAAAMLARDISAVDWARGAQGEPRLLLAGTGFCHVWDLNQRRAIAGATLPLPCQPGDKGDPSWEALLNQPATCAVDAALSLLAVSFHDSSRLYLIDLSDSETVIFRDIGECMDIQHIHMTPDASEAWLRVHNRLYRVQLQDSAVVDVIDYALADQRFEDAPLVVSPDQQRYAFLQYKKMLVVRARGAEDCTLPGTRNGLPRAFSIDGTRLLTLGNKNELREYDAAQGVRLALHRGRWCESNWWRTAAAWVAGRPVFVGLHSSERRWIEVWDVLDNRMMYRVSANADGAYLTDPDSD